jgi:hypothetical protein
MRSNRSWLQGAMTKHLGGGGDLDHLGVDKTQIINESPRSARPDGTANNLKGPCTDESR